MKLIKAIALSLLGISLAAPCSAVGYVILSSPTSPTQAGGFKTATGTIVNLNQVFNSDPSKAAFIILGTTFAGNGSKYIGIGYDPNQNAAWFQAENQGSAYTRIYLNPLGGNIVVGGGVIFSTFTLGILQSDANGIITATSLSLTTAPIVGTLPNARLDSSSVTLQGQNVVTGSSVSQTYVNKNNFSRTARTRQIFLSGSGIYTTPAGVLYIQARLVGGGGGGGGSGATGGGNGVVGSSTTFITVGSTLNAGSGQGGSGATTGGAGGTPTGSGLSSSVDISTGGYGTDGTYSSVSSGGSGGVNHRGGSGDGGFNGSAGASGVANTGAGGGGGAMAGVVGNSGGGGGAGGYIDALIGSPAATYTYSVGAGGSAGTAGTSGSIGGTGASGVIIVDEFYN